MRVLTLATLDSLPRARVLARSLRAHQPDWTHEVVLVAGEEVVAAAAESDQTLRVRAAASELDLDVEALLALHDEHDLIALLAPRLLARCAQRASEPALHLPSTVWVLADLQPIESALSRSGVLLVPRLTAELPDDGLEPTPAQLERAGRIDQTIMGVDGSAAAQAFLAWWRGHVEESLGSLDARRAGDRPEDRPWLARFLELAPARFSTAVLDDPGCNVNLWNLHRRTLKASASGALVNGRRPLRFLNLPGFEPDRPYRLAANASRARVSRSPVLHELCERYASELRHAGWHDMDHHGEVGRRLDGGLVYDDSLRAAYASALALGQGAENLFDEAGTREFIAWLQGPAPRGRAYGINRYVFHRVARERPDVVRSYPDLDGPDGAEYVAWCWAFGRDELAIPDRFMPPEPGSAAAGALTAETPGRSASEPEQDATVQAAGPHSAPGMSDPEAWTQDERAGARPSVAEDRSRPAVRVTGYLGHTLGLGAAGRGYVQALQAAGVAVSTASVPLHHLELPVELQDGYGRHGFEELVHEGRHGFEIVAVNADELPDFVERLGEDYFEGPRIGIWGWETDSIPARWQRAFALVQEISGLLTVHGAERRRGRAGPRDRPASAGAATRRAGRAGATGRARRWLHVPIRVRLPEHDPAQEPGRPDRGVQARVRAWRGSAAAAQDAQRAAAPAG